MRVLMLIVFLNADSRRKIFARLVHSWYCRTRLRQSVELLLREKTTTFVHLLHKLQFIIQQ
jgi:hypothetical protein